MRTHHFAALTAALTFLLLLIGGIVHGTGSSLACPDWPLCFGQLFPEMKGNVLIEHGHRLVASTVGLLTVILAGLLWQRRGLLRALGLIAVGLVCFQGLLGGLTVIYRLPTLISTAHLMTSMVFLSLLVAIVALSWPAQEPRTAWLLQPGTRGLLLAATALCYLQISLGGLVRHTGAGLACLDNLVLCRGQLLPVGEHPTAMIHVLHRLNALVVGALVLVTALKLYWAGRPTGARRALVLCLPWLVLVQITLGALSVLSFLGLSYVTAHLGVAALLLADLVGLCMLSSTAPAYRTAPMRTGLTGEAVAT